ncbi:site-specific integrase [Burkholderia sp. BCC0322]|uniref:site-specific integrase n=1 Tax=unclassified Burkholderia TaxID=2613784 RepID=UPI0015899E25|nr:site-specific integrase [Burkholderia sp. BCC0322]
MATAKTPNNKPPRGIQVVQWTNGDGSTTTKYRVRISRKDYQGKKNNYFDNLKEAVSFLTLSKLEKGKELIYSISEEERQKARKEAIKEKEGKDFTFEYVAKRWLQDEAFKDEGFKRIDIDDKEALKALPELKRRNLAMKKAFINKICSVSIPDRYITNEEKEAMGIGHEKLTYRLFGKFDIRTEISKIDINNYIKSRLEGDAKNKAVKPVSVVREITFISNVYNNLENIDEAYEDIRNVTKEYNKKLLQNTINYRKRVLTEEEESKFLEVISTYSNKQLADICRLSLLTSMRRSEIIYLKHSQIFDDFRRIHLTTTKSGRPRDVYLDETAREFLRNLKPAKEAEKDRFFTYTIMGFGRVFSGLMKANNLEDIHFHDLRRTKVSKMLSVGGEGNTMLIAKLLGFSSVRKFEEIHTKGNTNLSTQQGMLNSNGHNNEVSYKHYLNPILTEVDKLAKLKFLRAKKKEQSLSAEEEKELLNLLLELTE